MNRLVLGSSEGLLRLEAESLHESSPGSKTLGMRACQSRALKERRRSFVGSLALFQSAIIFNALPQALRAWAGLPRPFRPPLASHRVCRVKSLCLRFLASGTPVQPFNRRSPSFLNEPTSRMNHLFEGWPGRLRFWRGDDFREANRQLALLPWSSVLEAKSLGSMDSHESHTTPGSLGSRAFCTPRARCSS